MMDSVGTFFCNDIAAIICEYAEILCDRCFRNKQKIKRICRDADEHIQKLHDQVIYGVLIDHGLYYMTYDINIFSKPIYIKCTEYIKIFYIQDVYYELFTSKKEYVSKQEPEKIVLNEFVGMLTHGKYSPTHKGRLYEDTWTNNLEIMFGIKNKNDSEEMRIVKHFGLE